MQYAHFITGEIGTLASPTTQSGKLAFLRLIGMVYLKKSSSGFDTPSPATHYSTFTQLGLPAEQQHYMWLNSIREATWYHILFENEMMASNEALEQHWK